MDSAQLRPIVETLRQLHRANGRSGGSSAARPAAAKAAPVTPDSFVAVALRALKRIAAEQPPERRAGAPARTPDRGSFGTLHDLLAHSDATAERRRRLIDRIIEQMQAGARVDRIDPPSPLQQELRILVSPDGHGGGRFAVVNDLGEAARIRFEAQSIDLARVGGASDAAVAFDPADLTLGAGESRTVALSVAVDPRSIAGDCAFSVKVKAGDRVLASLWVELLPPVRPTGEA